MNQEVQQIVETLAAGLSRAVAVDDRNLRLLAYSPHYGAVDEARMHSILHRRAAEPAIEYILELGIREAKGPVRIPPNPEFGIEERLCVPVRARNVCLGFLWLIDSDSSLRPREIADARKAADEIAALVFRDSLRQEQERTEEQELFRELLSDETAAREAAAERLVTAGILNPAKWIRCLVVKVLDERDDDLRAVTLDIALGEVRRQLPMHRSIHLVVGDHGTLQVTSGSTSSTPDLLKVGRALRTSLQKALGGAQGPAHVVIGVGQAQADLECARTSYDQALLAADVAAGLELVDDIADWTTLGVYRTLAALSPAEVGLMVDEELTALMEEDVDGMLTHTLTTFLDNAGSAKRTVDDLHLHRTSLYYRLSKVEKITGLSLADGDHRLRLHLALRAAHLLGRLPVTS